MKKFFVVYGPTASGKTDYAIYLAKAYNGIVINGDSIQQFADLPLLTARPLADEQQGICHYLYGFLNADEQPNAMDWRTRAVDVIQEAWKEKKTPIIVGGTGLYLLSLLKGLSPIPQVPSSVNDFVLTRQKDPDFYDWAMDQDPCLKSLYHPHDVKRIGRAIRVFLSTGKSITYFYQLPMIDPYEMYAQKIYLAPPRALLHKRIEERFKNMIAKGAIDEVKNIQHIESHAPIFNTLGAKEIDAYLKGLITYDQMMEQSIQKTRQYAKRQYTFFNNSL
ncbi:MAG: tRNA dimethylallyltransferase [Holosporales bacterium]